MANNQNTADKIKCPECGKLIPITETLQHQLTESVRKEYEEKMSTQEIAFSEREKQITARAKELDDKEGGIEARVQKSLKTELDKQKIVLAQEARKAAEESLALEIKDLRENLKTKDKKLEEARETELTLRKREHELEERAKDMDLEVARKMDVERKRVEEDTTRRVVEGYRMKDAEKDKKMSDMMVQIEELKRKAEQGSQQTQGEVQELDLEISLKEWFPFDEIIPVPKGVRGADVIQKVNTRRGAVCGCILWESKRTKGWSDGWIGKLAGQDGLQVICTTHSPVFLDIAQKHKAIVRVMKDEARIVSFLQVTTELFNSPPSGEDEERERLQIIIRFDPFVNEVFFAKRVVLLEEQSAMVAFEIAAELSGLFSRHPNIQRDTTIVAAGGNTHIPIYQRVLNHFQIPYAVVFDEDSNNPSAKRTNDKIIALLSGTNNKSYLISPTDLEGLLGYAATGDKPYQAFKRVKELHSTAGLPEAFVKAMNFVYFGEEREP